MGYHCMYVHGLNIANMAYIALVRRQINSNTEEIPKNVTVTRKNATIMPAITGVDVAVVPEI